MCVAALGLTSQSHGVCGRSVFSLRSHCSLEIEKATFSNRRSPRCAALPRDLLCARVIAVHAQASLSPDVTIFRFWHNHNSSRRCSLQRFCGRALGLSSNDIFDLRAAPIQARPVFRSPGPELKLACQSPSPDFAHNLAALGASSNNFAGALGPTHCIRAFFSLWFPAGCGDCTNRHLCESFGQTLFSDRLSPFPQSPIMIFSCHFA